MQPKLVQVRLIDLLCRSVLDSMNTAQIIRQGEKWQSSEHSTVSKSQML